MEVELGLPSISLINHSYDFVWRYVTLLLNKYGNHVLDIYQKRLDVYSTYDNSLEKIKLESGFTGDVGCSDTFIALR